MAKKHEPDPRPATPRLKCVQLDAEVTNDFFHFEGRKDKAYSLLHRNGSFIRAENMDDPVVTATWADAVRLADKYSAPMIIIFHEERIKHKREMPNGGTTWDRVIFWPHDSALSFEAELPPTTKEPDAHGRSQTSFRKAKHRAFEKHTRERDKQVKALIAKLEKDRIETKRENLRLRGHKFGD